MSNRQAVIVYQFVRVERSWSEATEQLGTKRKFWYRDDDNRRILFKADERKIGEDWAEKIACELCELLGLPHVHYDLAEEYDQENTVRPGVVCLNCAPSPRILVLGNQLLLAFDPEYPGQKKRKVTQHTIENVAKAIGLLELSPDEWIENIPSSVTTAHDVFVGYLMLDAWVANQDRHHENWAALFDGSKLQLAPTFDHGSSLARNLSDEDRQERLVSEVQERQVAHFASRARSRMYGQVSDTRALGTHEAFWQFADIDTASVASWLKRLEAIDEDAIWAILNKVPSKRMSKIAKEFTLRLLLVNQQRLLEA